MILRGNIHKNRRRKVWRQIEGYEKISSSRLRQIVKKMDARIALMCVIIVILMLILIDIID